MEFFVVAFVAGAVTSIPVHVRATTVVLTGAPVGDVLGTVQNEEEFFGVRVGQGRMRFQIPVLVATSADLP